TAAIASFVIQPWAWSSTAIDPPVSASRLAGKVNGSTQQAVQATAASAVIEAVAASLLPVFFGVARARPGEFSAGTRQDGPITLMGSYPAYCAITQSSTPSSHLRFKRKIGDSMRIGALAERTGISVATIRYYEEIGLLRRVARRGGQRVYDHADAHRL